MVWALTDRGQGPRLSHPRGVRIVLVIGTKAVGGPRAGDQSRPAATHARRGGSGRLARLKDDATMITVWVLLFVCAASSPSCEQGDVSVATTSYASSEEC